MSFFKNRMVLGCICIIIAIFIGFYAVPKLSFYLATDVTEVVVMNEDIKKGTKIENNMLKIEELKTDTLPNNYIRSENKEDLIGKYSVADIFKDDVLTDAKVTDEGFSSKDSSYLNNLEKGQIAITIQLNEYQTSVGCRIEPNDVVTIFGEDGAIDPDIVYVKVISIQDADTNNIDADSENPLTFVTLDLNIAQAQKVTKLSKDSSIYLGLAAKGNSDKATKLLEQQKANFSTQTMGILANWYAQ